MHRPPACPKASRVGGGSKKRTGAHLRARRRWSSNESKETLGGKNYERKIYETTFTYRHRRNPGKRPKAASKIRSRRRKPLGQGSERLPDPRRRRSRALSAMLYRCR